MRRSQIAVVATALWLVALVVGLLIGFSRGKDEVSKPEYFPRAAKLITPTTAVTSSSVAALEVPPSSVIAATEPTTAPIQPFRVTPDYSNDPAGVCTVRPCWQPIFDQPGGRRVTDGWPCEYYSEASYSPEAPYCASKTTDQGDAVTVVCQFQDMNVGGSTWWDRVEIPPEHLVEGHGLTPVDGKYYGVAPDRWLGNTGDHGMPCQ